MTKSMAYKKKTSIIINGLTEEDILSMYSFLKEFECHIKSMKKDSELKQRYPRINSIIKNKKGDFYKKVIGMPRKDIKTKYQDKSYDCIYCTISQRTTILSFFRHLRNCFAHVAMRREDDDNIYLKDAYHEKLTMFGNLRYSYLQKIIDSIRN